MLTSPANNAAYAAPATVSLAASVTANGHAITAVQFYNGANLLGQDTTAPYTFTWSGVAAGSYSLTAQVVYDATNTLASTAANVTVTNLPAPAIALTSPANNAAYAAPPPSASPPTSPPTATPSPQSNSTTAPICSVKTPLRLTPSPGAASPPAATASPRRWS